uniref:DUF5641 domain-containing protein n=1 Tax=Amphimedon queenslandica TaxID=400682 RepID=A0A1X7VKF3_AMPQE
MASQDEIATLSHSLRKKRGVIRSSITRLGTKLKELEDSSHLPTTTGQAEQIAAKLHKLDAEFKDLHLQIVDVTEAEDDLEREQDILDKHDDRISDFQLRVSEVCTASSTRTPVDAPEKVIISRRLSRLEKNLTAAHTIISSLPDSHDDTSLFEQYREQMSEYKTELAQLYEEMLINSFPENDAPLAPLISNDDGIEVLTPGHFLIGRPLMTLPQQTQTKKLSLLKRWELCQTLVVHFWKRWSAEYLISLNRFNKWHSPSRNINVGDIVLLKEDNTLPSQWPLARIINTHPGNDGLVRVVTLKTSKGTYKRPITKLVVLLPID